jgi:hypothetical protein
MAAALMRGSWRRHRLPYEHQAFGSLIFIIDGGRVSVLEGPWEE